MHLDRYAYVYIAAAHYLFVVYYSNLDTSLECLLPIQTIVLYLFYIEQLFKAIVQKFVLDPLSNGKGDLAELAETMETPEFLSGRASTALAL